MNHVIPPSKILAEDNHLGAGSVLSTGRHSFTLQNKIGKGGFGITYFTTVNVPFTCFNRVIGAGERLVLKECFNERLMVRTAGGWVRLLDENRGKNVQNRFRQEAQQYGKIRTNFPSNIRDNMAKMGVVPIYHAARHVHPADPGLRLYYFIMPYIGGGSLKEQAGNVNAKQLCYILARMLKTLGYLHDDGDKTHRTYIHRDIKPANIMLTAEGEPVLIDYGLIGASGYTKAYASPEQLNKELRNKDLPVEEQLDKTTDLYSLGASFYELITHDRNRPQDEHAIYERLKTGWVKIPGHELVDAWFEGQYNAATGENYRDKNPRHRSFSDVFLLGIAAALRAERRGHMHRWKSASGWFGYVFAGYEPTLQAKPAPEPDLVPPPSPLPSPPAPPSPLADSSLLLSISAILLAVVLVLILFLIFI